MCIIILLISLTQSDGTLLAYNGKHPYLKPNGEKLLLFLEK